MSFESGAVSFRLFHLPHALPGGHVRLFAQQALPPINVLGREPLQGWVTGRHLLDRTITEETAFAAGYLRLTLTKAERKIPEALLRAECTMEELAVMQAEGTAYVKRDKRTEIKKQIVERLLPTMPPTLSGMAMVFDERNKVLYAAACSEKQVEVFALAFQQAVGVSPVPLTAEAVALQRKRIRVGSLPPTSFSPELEDELAPQSIGQDFLTWLWFHWEHRGGVLNVDGQEVAAILEGPLVFVMEGEGAHVATLRNGAPLIASEAKTALMSGKKLRKAKVTLSLGQETWTALLDADSFTFSGMKIPKSEQDLGPIDRFHERMLSLERFRGAFLGYYDRFLEERSDAAGWKTVQKDIHAWASGRQSRR
jgi:hypothetical protein